MNIKSILVPYILLAACTVTFGQKVKYKDLFVLLNAKNFTESEHYLKKYLKDNVDNPNAYLFMGLIYEDKASKLDILKKTELYVNQVDSAVYFFTLASKGMTEKEVSKHDEYYQMYNRRDLRTGEFGVKHSDVLLDLEMKIKLKERARLALVLKSQFVAAEKAYDRALSLFKELQSAYADQKQLYLRADEKLVAQLNHLARVADSCNVSFNDYKATSTSLGKTGYNQDLDPLEINDFKKDGITPADFYLDDLKVWDYKRWALSSAEVIEKEINPIKEQLITLDIEINKLQQKLKKDSVSVRQEVSALKSKGFPELLKIDSHPLPLLVFGMKETELEFGSQVVENRSLKDSLSVSLHLQAFSREIVLLKKLDSAVNLLAERNLDEDVENYKHFVTTAYGTSSVLKSLIRGTKDLALREIAIREGLIRKKTESLRWIVSGADSIPLFTEVLAIGRFKPLIIVDEKYTAGIMYQDTVGTGYFYAISPSRNPTVKATYQVDKQAFKKRYIPVTKAISTQDEKGLVYFILTYLEAKVKDKYPATITKIYKLEGLSWSVNVGFDQLPTELIFTLDSSELSVKTKSSIGEMFVTTFDRNGKPLK